MFFIASFLLNGFNFISLTKAITAVGFPPYSRKAQPIIF